MQRCSLTCLLIVKLILAAGGRAAQAILAREAPPGGQARLAESVVVAGVVAVFFEEASSLAGAQSSGDPVDGETRAATSGVVAARVLDAPWLPLSLSACAGEP